MDYQIGRVGRVIVAKGLDGESVYEEIQALCAKENVRCASVLVLGGLRSGKVISGPKVPADPNDALSIEFDDAREIAGVGTIFHDEAGPKLHLHGAIGRGGEPTIAGCPRGGAKVYCLLEVVIIEIEGVEAARRLDPRTGLKMLMLDRPKTTK